MSGRTSINVHFISRGKPVGSLLLFCNVDSRTGFGIIKLLIVDLLVFLCNKCLFAFVMIYVQQDTEFVSCRLLIKSLVTWPFCKWNKTVSLVSIPLRNHVHRQRMLFIPRMIRRICLKH